MSHTHPASYTAYSFQEVGGQLQKISVAWKDPEPGHVVVKVFACGVCGSDEHVQSGALGPLPRVPGHEIVGDIVAVPPTEKFYKIGQRVGGGWHGGHCGDCRNCRSGSFDLCTTQIINGVSADGGYAEYATLRRECLALVPEGLDPAEAAPLFCAGVTVFNSLRNMDASPGDLVAVSGIGGLGHLAVQYAHALGFRTAALSSSPSKKDLAEKLGADYYIDSSEVDQAQALKQLGGAKVIMCTAPYPKVIESLIPGLAIDGTLLLLAIGGNITIPMLQLVVGRQSIRGWPSGAPKDIDDTLLFTRDEKLKVMVEKYPLEKAQEAYDRRANARFRVVLIP